MNETSMKNEDTTKSDVKVEDTSVEEKTKSTRKAKTKKVDNSPNTVENTPNTPVVKEEVSKHNVVIEKPAADMTLEQARAILAAEEAKKVKTTVDLVDPVAKVIHQDRGMARLVTESAQGPLYRQTLVNNVLKIVGSDKANPEDVSNELSRQLGLNV